MGLTNQSASIPHCFAQWREQGSYAPWDWKEAAAWITAFPTVSSASECWDTLCGRSHGSLSPGEAQAGAALLREGRVCASDSHAEVLAPRKGHGLQEMAIGWTVAWEVTAQRHQCHSSREMLSWESSWDRQVLHICLYAQSWLQRLCFPGGVYSEIST